MLSSRVAGNAALSSHHHEININGLKMIPWAGSQGYALVYFHLLKEDIIRWEEGGARFRDARKVAVVPRPSVSGLIVFSSTFQHANKFDVFFINIRLFSKSVLIAVSLLCITKRSQAA
jgi:hypothetical protein